MKSTKHVQTQPKRCNRNMNEMIAYQELFPIR